MATTVFRRDHLLRRLVNPGTVSVDSTGRATTSTTDYLGRPLKAIVWAATAVVPGDMMQTTTNLVYVCTSAGTPAAGDPTPPGYGNTVVSGTATMRQLTTA
jgi:hypothetical protein